MGGCAQVFEQRSGSCRQIRVRISHPEATYGFLVWSEGEVWENSVEKVTAVFVFWHFHNILKKWSFQSRWWPILPPGRPCWELSCIHSINWESNMACRDEILFSRRAILQKRWTNLGIWAKLKKVRPHPWNRPYFWILSSELNENYISWS